MPDTPPPPPAALEPRAARQTPRAAKGRSLILQHYHDTGCADGAFSWRAAMMDPEKPMVTCVEAREYRDTTHEDIERSKNDKQRGMGPRVGPFQECIPGNGWQALPKYDFTSQNRSCAFNERMHVEWENHVDHILKNGGELPVASVVAKAGFRSCAPCCRDMIALARPTGKSFIMVDLAEEDSRGTFHFVSGCSYLPVPKEACSTNEVAALKSIVCRAQEGVFASGADIVNAVVELGVPIDETARSLYLSDAALLPEGCAVGLKGDALLKVLHAEHFARLTAEYGASILRGAMRPSTQRAAILQCRAHAKQSLIDAWAPHLLDTKLDLQAYAAAAVAPLLPEEPEEYEHIRRSRRVPRAAATRVPTPPLGRLRLQGAAVQPAVGKWKKRPSDRDEDTLSVITTAVPDDTASAWSDSQDPADI